MKKIVSLLFLAVAALATPPVVFESAQPFRSEELFQKLDEKGGGGTWMEWDADGVLDSAIAAIVMDEKGQIRRKVEHGWLLNSPNGKKLFALLEKKEKGEKLSFFEIGKISTKKVPLDIKEPLQAQTVFRDYREKLPGLYVHLDDTNLQVAVRQNEIQFSYLKPDAKPIAPIPHFAMLSESQKLLEIQTRRDFYAYEYALMVQAFIASTRDLFNWQIWHWYNKDWISSAMISEREISAILSSPDQSKFVRIFFQKLSSGGFVEMQTNSHGSFLLTIRR